MPPQALVTPCDRASAWVTATKWSSAAAAGDAYCTARITNLMVRATRT